MPSPAARKGAAPPGARDDADDRDDEPGAPGVLTLHDLSDPGRFHTVRGVPVFDAHSDPEKGDIPPALLALIAENSNDRAARHNFPAITAGHTRRKDTMIVVHPDGRKVVYPATPETAQPAILGYASNFRVGDFHGAPTIFADHHIRREHLDDARALPFRSVERMEPAEHDPAPDPRKHRIDRIALLKTAPERDLGAVHYERTARRVCYSRDDLPPLWAAPGGDAPPPSVTPDGSTPSPTIFPDPSEDTMPLSPEDLQAIRSMMEETFDSKMAAILEHDETDPEGDPEGDAPPVPYEEEATDRDPNTGEDGMQAYAEGEGTPFVPTEEPACPARRQNYERTEVRRPAARRVDYARRADDQDAVIVDLANRVYAYELKDRRTDYARDLRGLVESDGIELDDAAIDALVAKVDHDTPEGYEAEKVAEISTHYRRSIVGRPGLPVGGPRVGAEPPMDLETSKRIAAVAFTKGVTFHEAQKLVKAGTV